MPFGQKLKSGILSGINFTKNLLQKTYHHGKQALGIVDKGVRLGSGIYDSVKPALQNLAPAAMQGSLDKLNTHVERAQDKYNTLRYKIDQGEQKVVQNIVQVMGNSKRIK